MSNIDTYIGIGSNLANPAKQVETAIKELGELNASTLHGSSPLYQSKPVGPQDQPDYINAVVRLNTQLSPIELLDELQTLEQQHERKRLKHWGPRTLDLDILLYGDQIIDEPRLTIPTLICCNETSCLFHYFI